MARLKRVAISQDLFIKLITEGTLIEPMVVIEGIPNDAELVRSYYDDARGFGTAYLVFHHPSFEDIPIGGFVPEISVVFDTKVGQENAAVIIKKMQRLLEEDEI